ncbi:unnamed protein product [Symbiodinium natans]|uniref:Uncharacterized protein n=1 Tax=Symbiodinium natans TaxID=878477 RepID=A0A812K975_9DINO|nr:unnamed protein product [Symbiodinium natans]
MRFPCLQVLQTYAAQAKAREEAEEAQIQGQQAVPEVVAGGRQICYATCIPWHIDSQSCDTKSCHVAAQTSLIHARRTWAQKAPRSGHLGTQFGL